MRKFKSIGNQSYCRPEAHAHVCLIANCACLSEGAFEADSVPFTSKVCIGHRSSNLTYYSIILLIYYILYWRDKVFILTYLIMYVLLWTQGTVESKGIYSLVTFWLADGIFNYSKSMPTNQIMITIQSKPIIIFSLFQRKSQCITKGISLLHLGTNVNLFSGQRGYIPKLHGNPLERCWYVIQSVMVELKGSPKSVAFIPWNKNLFSQGQGNPMDSLPLHSFSVQ